MDNGVTASRLRIAGRGDLAAVNSVVEGAVGSWDAAERVKRLAQPVYRYREDDLDHMWLVVAEDGDGSVAGVAAVEDADGNEAGQYGRALQLHGIFVRPGDMGKGIGTELLATSSRIADALGYDGL